MQKRKVQDLSVLDDFLFGSIVSYPGIGKEFCRRILKVILGEDVEEIQIIPQRVYYGADTDKHGTRLDVYIEETKASCTGTIYDVEPDQNSGTEKVNSLPKRVRFYHARIDTQSLESGADYSCLKRVIVIMLMPYDPFGMNRMVYTVRNMCEEETKLHYDDGARTLFLYTKGEMGDPPEELRQLLHYLEDSREENADTDLLKEIHHMVQTVKQDKEVSLEYMKIFEREQMIREEGQEEGAKRITELTRRLIQDGRMEELRLSTEDENLQKKLLEEYGL